MVRESATGSLLRLKTKTSCFDLRSAKCSTALRHCLRIGFVPTEVWPARPFKKKSFALKILLRRYSYASPCSELVPAFVLRLVTPPENLPHSGPRLLV